MKDSLIGPIALCVFIFAGLVVTFYLVQQPPAVGEINGDLIQNTSSRSLIDATIEPQSSARTIIYGSVLSDSEIQKAREDCLYQGGIFNACGRACSDPEETCIAVCAYTCTILGITF